MTTATGTRATMPASSMSPRRKTEHRLEIDPAFLRELAGRITALGEDRVRVGANVSKQSMWRVMRLGTDAKQGDQAPSFDVVERLRAEVMRHGGPPIPPPFIAVGGPKHPSWKTALAAPRKRR